MSTADVRERWRRFHADVSARAIENKCSNDALVALAARYRSLSAEERDIVNRLLAEQLGCDDETLRYDALALIADFEIRSAVPALRRLADWLETQPGPGAPHEWTKVNRIIAALNEQ